MLASIMEYFIHGALIIGVLGLLVSWVLSFIPLVGQYRLPIQVISVILFSVSLWYEGSLAKDRQWKSKIQELEAKLAQAKIESEKVNTEVVTNVVTRKQVIKEKGKTVIEYIDREVVKYDSSCPLPQDVISAHNAAALNDISILGADTEINVQDHNSLAKSKIKLVPKK